jgi:hypothetical protein
MKHTKPLVTIPMINCLNEQFNMSAQDYIYHRINESSGRKKEYRAEFRRLAARGCECQKR